LDGGVAGVVGANAEKVAIHRSRGRLDKVVAISVGEGKRVEDVCRERRDEWLCA
jgi:hypothetical protein